MSNRRCEPRRCSTSAAPRLSSSFGSGSRCQASWKKQHSKGPRVSNPELRSRRRISSFRSSPPIHLLNEQGDLAGALEYTQRALAIGEKFYGTDHPQVAIYANNIGQILKDQGDLAG